jgi:hypothetical protein
MPIRLNFRLARQEQPGNNDQVGVCFKATTLPKTLSEPETALVRGFFAIPPPIRLWTAAVTFEQRINF